jgi:hypothetical protein
MLNRISFGGFGGFCSRGEGDMVITVFSPGGARVDTTVVDVHHPSDPLGVVNTFVYAHHCCIDPGGNAWETSWEMS